MRGRLGDDGDRSVNGLEDELDGVETAFGRITHQAVRKGFSNCRRTNYAVAVASRKSKGLDQQVPHRQFVFGFFLHESSQIKMATASSATDTASASTATMNLPSSQRLMHAIARASRDLAAGVRFIVKF